MNGAATAIATAPVIVALGSNLGDSTAILQRAFQELEPLAAAGFTRSSLWRTRPVDCPPASPDFLNAACVWIPRTADTPESLLDRLQAIERRFGRRPKQVLNEPRPLDLDLIAFGQFVRSLPHLTLPHPRAHLRRFVLEPLHELAPDWVLPGTAQTVRALLSRLPPEPSPPVRVAG